MPNRLALVTSPYLRQHADNPVDWYVWGAEALQRARTEDKPILLSIGYSACHWCHVMAHESFEDAEVAAVMNALFINIKVDREERPDLDQIYQTAHWMLTRRGGGWPLTMFLTPDQIPFLGGTYFPKTPRYNLPGFKDLLARVAAFYRENRAAIATQNASLVGALDSMLPIGETGAELSPAPIERALQELRDSFDNQHGGFGAAPKFPHPTELALCLRRHARSGDQSARHMALFTLERMSAGGIYDQLGGGFSRYSVDASWTIPHFEKMLYDNAPLLTLYTDAWLMTSTERFRTVVEETAAWVMREMQSPQGGYYSSIDADSEHEEGKFYVWSREEFRAALKPEEYAVAAPYYALDQAPNFEDHAWHPRITQPLTDLATRLGTPLAEAESRLRSARQKLFAVRAQRVHPGRDDKVLTSWNALMIKAMLRAGAGFSRVDWSDSARRALDFVRSVLWRDGRLLATYRDGQAALNAYLDDYAFLLEALLESIQAQFRTEDLRFAQAIAEVLLAQFEDRDQGGFHFTSHDHERLIHRPKPGQDNATPAGNAVAAYAVQRLGHLVGEPRYLAAAQRALHLFYPAMQQHASGCATLLMALEEYLSPPHIVVLRGPEQGLRSWREALTRQYLPHCMIVAISGAHDALPATLSHPAGASVNAWVCQGVSCLPPIGDLSELNQVCNAARTAV